MLALLALTVIVPTGVVLWFMLQAMGSERLAVRQRLADAYRAQLAGVRSTLEAEWTTRIKTLAEHDRNGSAPRRFATAVREDLADSLVLYDPGGRPEYPATYTSSAPSPNGLNYTSTEWNWPTAITNCSTRTN